MKKPITKKDFETKKLKKRSERSREVARALDAGTKMLYAVKKVIDKKDYNLFYAIKDGMEKRAIPKVQWDEAIASIDNTTFEDSEQSMHHVWSRVYGGRNEEGESLEVLYEGEEIIDMSWIKPMMTFEEYEASLLRQVHDIQETAKNRKTL
jgi:hypothetical protein